MTDFDLPVIESPHWQEDTAILIGNQRLWSEPLRIRRVPWRPPPFWWGESAQDEWRRAHDHLAGLLDGLCEAWGLDPDDTWRDPKAAEALRRSNEYAIQAELRVSMDVMRPPDGFTVITGV